jgi:16S rRNA (cytosine1407-C5)-methyltransferase
MPGLPGEFLASMQAILPAHLTMEAFIAACQRPLRTSLRVNTLKISVSEFVQLAERYAWQLHPIPWCAEGFWLERSELDETRLGNAFAHLAGLFYIQEASSMLPVTALFADGNHPATVLDVAAAPGSKTTQIAAQLGKQGIVVANEYSASRIKVLHANLNRCGVVNSALTHFDGRVFGSALPESFDAVLLDAPCSGEGVVRKDPAAMENWSQESIVTIAATQRELINSAFHALKPGGILIYSTCTLNTKENQQVCQWLLDEYPGQVEVVSLCDLFTGADQALTEQGYLHVFPNIYDTEGFFVARLRKTGTVARLPAANYKLGKFPFVRLQGKACQEITQLAHSVGIIWSEALFTLWQRDQELWLFPATVIPYLDKVRFSRIGVKLAERFAKGVRWQHEAVTAFGDPDSANNLELNDEQAQCWFRGTDFYPDQPPEFSECLLSWQHQPLGLAKRINSRIKNSLPREWVRDGAIKF